MSRSNSPSSSLTTVPPNSPVSGNPVAIPDRLRAAIAAKDRQKSADQLEMEAEQLARDIRRLKSMASLESLKPIDPKTVETLLKPPRTTQGLRDPAAVDLPDILARKIQLADLRESLRVIRENSTENLDGSEYKDDYDSDNGAGGEEDDRTSSGPAPGDSSSVSSCRRGEPPWIVHLDSALDVFSPKC